MKNLKLIAVAAIIALSACNEKEGTESKTKQNEQTAEYTCPMHPEVKSDKPGKCPECGMELEKVEQK